LTQTRLCLIIRTQHCSVVIYIEEEVVIQVLRLLSQVVVYTY